MQTGPRPADFADVRATNLAVVLRYVRAKAPCSRADIAAATGLNKATVSSLVADLIDRRLLRETGLTEHRIGRPATMLVLDGSPYAAVGLEVNADYLTAVAMDLAGTQLLSWRRSFTGLTASPSKAIAGIASLARRAVNRVNKEGRQVLGLTVGVPGLVDGGGSVRLAPNLDWQDVDLHADLVRALGSPEYPVAVENDANLAAMAEFRYGPHAGTANLVYLTGEVGIGAGVILDGRLVHGGRGFAGEIGHVQVDPAGPKCGCGRRGCLEAVAGIAALIARVAPEAAADGPLTDFGPEIDEVVRRAAGSDAAVLDALADTGRHLGHAASILANVLNPEMIIIGGYFVPLAPWLLPSAQAELSARTIAPDAGGARLVASELALDAAAIGAAARVLDDVDAGDLPQPTP
jgi:predicted NBD/HSP70 family sugar kinase